MSTQVEVVAGDSGEPVADRGYWYEVSAEHRARKVLEAVRIYRAAEVAMRRRTRESMSMGENELLVLRYLLRESSNDVAPSDLARYLGVSSAATTALLDKLEKSGHVRRDPHPSDRRRLIIRITADADSEVRATLGEMHQRMMAVAEALSPEEARVIVGFFQGMSDAVDAVSADGH